MVPCTVQRPNWPPAGSANRRKRRAGSANRRQRRAGSVNRRQRCAGSANRRKGGVKILAKAEEAILVPTTASGLDGIKRDIRSAVIAEGHGITQDLNDFDPQVNATPAHLKMRRLTLCLPTQPEP